MTPNRTRVATLIASAALTLALPITIGAQEGSWRDRNGSYARPSDDRLRELARDLDEAARRANVRAQRDQLNRREKDTKFLSAMDDFAEAATLLRRRTETSRSGRSLDAVLDRLVEEARDVEYRLRRARYADADTRQDWQRAAFLLNRITSEYRYQGSPVAGNRPDRGYSDDGYASAVLPLARELEQRAERTADLARRDFRYPSGGGIEHFADQARDFRNRVDDGRLTREQVRVEVIRLVQDAERAQNDLSTRGQSAQVRVEWNGVIQTLHRIRQVTAA